MIPHWQPSLATHAPTTTHLSSSFLNYQEPSQNTKTKVQYNMSLYHAMYCTNATVVREQKAPRVSEDKRCQRCQRTKGAKGARGQKMLMV